MKIVQRPAIAIVAIIVGVVVLFVSTPLLMLSDGGWPWHTSITSSAADGLTTVDVVEEDGAAHRFTGSSADAHKWLDRTEDELRNAHGIPTKIVVGEVLQPVGLALVLLGVVLLLWRLVAAVRSRGTASPAKLTSPSDR